MTYQEFIDIVPILKRLDLPAEKAHLIQKPFKEGSRNEALKKDLTPRLSGVAAIVADIDHKAQLVLIERQSYKGVHSGQIGFPGGKKEDFDLDLESTARRETYEEIGVLKTDLDLIMPISDIYIPPSRFLVSPFLYTLEKPPVFVPEPREVKTILTFSLQRLLNEDSIKIGSVPLANGIKIKTPYFELDNHMIWGATAMMMSEIKSLIKTAIQ